MSDRFSSKLVTRLPAPKSAFGPRARWLRAAPLPALAVLLGSCSSGAPESVSTARAPLGSADIVISQVYGGSGTGSDQVRNDYVELFNRSQSDVTLTNWSVQYASATGTGNFQVAATFSGTIKAGQYFLVQLASGGSTGNALPTSDASGTLNLGSAAGKIALANVGTALACNSSATCSSLAGNIVDLVGYGTANYFEGSVAPAPSLNTALFRTSGGCTDTDQNGTDFTTAAPAPRNSGSPIAKCSTANVAPQVSKVSPANGATNIPVDSTIAVTFSEAVTTTDPWFTLHCTTSGAVTATVSGGPQAYTLKPATSLANAETCTLTISAAAVQDSDSTPMAADFVSTFTTIAADGLTRIHSIQGASHISPLNNTKVTTRGIVTAVASNGYYLQDPAPDNDDATSEGIFVFTSPSVKVGDDVQVSGTVSEFRSGCTPCSAGDSAFANLTSTELGTITQTSVITSANALPAPIVIGADGRKSPTEVIKDGVNGDVEVTPGTFDPTHNGLDFYESLEDMRVQVNDAVVVGPTDTFSGGSLEIPVLADNGVGTSVRTPRGGILVSANDFNPERITLANDLQPALPTNANVGDTFPGAIVGIMSYTFAEPKLFPTTVVPALAATGVTQETTTLPARVATDLDIAAFNVENLAPSDPDSKYAALAKILVTNMKAPDLVSLEEIQDNSGATDDGVIIATATLDKLVAAIATAGGPAYSYRSIDPVNDKDGGQPGGNIRVAFMYRTDRGLAFVDKPGGDSTTANTVVAGANGPELQFSPGRVDPNNDAWVTSRKPLAGQFTFQGKTFFVIANHFNSKGGDDPLFGRFQPPKLVSETQRVKQATVLSGFIGQILALDANAQVIALGDLNDFEFSEPLTVLKSAGMSTLVETLPANERYTYVYQGNSQVLDQVLVSAGTHVGGYDVVHVNSEFAAQVSDHDPGVARFTFDTNQGTGGTGGTGGGGAAGMSGGGAGGSSAGGVSGGGVGGVSAGGGGAGGSGGSVVVGGGGTAGAGGSGGSVVIGGGGTSGGGAGGTLSTGGAGGTSTGGGGAGGASAGTGGASAGTGGASAGTGGASAGTGGATNTAGTGGASTQAGTGGTPSEAGAGGELEGEAGTPSTSGGSAGVGGKGGGTAGKSNAEAGQAGESNSKPSSNDDSGCSCSTIPAQHSNSPLLLGLGVVVLGLTRRRRHQAE